MESERCLGNGPEDGTADAVGIGERRIRNMDGYVHAVDGKPICFERHMFSLSSASDREVLFRVARGIRCGDEVCVLADPGDGSGNYVVEMRGIGSFPLARQQAIRGIIRESRAAATR